MKTRHLRLFILELVRYLISLFVFLWMQSGDSSAEFWISSHTTPLPPQLYGNLFRMQGRKSPPHILSPTSSDTFLVSQNGVKASLDVTEMVFCCIVAWIQSGCQARFSAGWKWNRFRIVQNDQNNFILRQTRFIWQNRGTMKHNASSLMLCCFFGLNYVSKWVWNMKKCNVVD